jgi:hypothetical protein
MSIAWIARATQAVTEGKVVSHKRSFVRHLYAMVHSFSSSSSLDGIVKMTIPALSPKQLREHGEQSIADVAIARAAHRRKARSSAQALAGLIPHGTDLPTDLSARHNA